MDRNTKLAKETRDLNRVPPGMPGCHEAAGLFETSRVLSAGASMSKCRRLGAARRSKSKDMLDVMTLPRSA
jgi:hypothetical protein